MVRSLVLLVVGIVIGAVGSYYYFASGAHSAATPRISVGDNPEAAIPALRPAGTVTLGADAPSVSDRLAVYQRAAQSDAAELEALIGEAFRRPASSLRRFTLTVLLGRYAEIDAGRAVRFARELGVDADLLASLFEAWAAEDARAALDALRNIDEPQLARAAGLAVLRGLGADGLNLQRVSAALPPDAQTRFVIDAIALTADAAPGDALRLALGLDTRTARLQAVQRVAGVWAARDPRGALQRANGIEDLELKSTFERAAFQQWARQDPEAMLAYVAAIPAAAQQQLLRNGVIQQIAQLDPRRALELTRDAPGILARVARQNALQQLAQQDPVAALAEVEALPVGQERQQLLQAVAQGYGAADPDAALAWARNLQPPARGVLGAVLRGIAQTDIDRALELAVNETSPVEQQQALMSIAMVSVQSAADTRRIADRLVAMQDGNGSRQALQMLTGAWASRDPRAALDWLLANSARVGPGAFQQVAQQLGQQDPATAALYTSQVPAEVRGQWIAEVAQGYARADPQGALSWIDQFRGDPAYESGVVAIVQSMAQFDPQTAARLLDGLGRSPGADPNSAINRASTVIASQWAQQNPRAAADWAHSLDAGPARSNALRIVAQIWGLRNSQTAHGWAMSLPVGGERDGALTGVVSGAAQNTVPAPSLMDGFSSDQARQQAVRVAVFAIAMRDPTDARAFADSYIADPALRAQAERQIKQAEQNAGRGFNTFGAPFENGVAIGTGFFRP